MIVKLAHQKFFQGPPQESGMQDGEVIRDQHHIGCIAAGMNLVRTTKRADTTLDPQTLLDDLELKQMRLFNLGDTLY
jgi:hypothetical protein